MPSIIVHPATASQWVHGSGGQLADCLAACADRSPRGPLVHVWSADSQPRTISLGTGLSCYANHSICSPEAFTVSVSARLRPPQIVPSGTQRARLVWSDPSRARYGHLAAGRGLPGTWPLD